MSEMYKLCRKMSSVTQWQISEYVIDDMASVIDDTYCRSPSSTDDRFVNVTVQEILEKPYANIRSNTRDIHPSTTPSAALQLIPRLHPYMGI